jgi:CheY-like chemotaxis protein
MNASHPTAPVGPILIAEDDPLDLTLLTNTLSLLDVEAPVATFGSGAAVLRYLDPAPAARIGRPPPILLLLDLKMPGIDGFEVISEIRRRGCFDDLPIVVVTGLESPKEVNRALELGADECLLKPVDVAALRHVLAEYCGAAVFGGSRREAVAEGSQD